MTINRSSKHPCNCSTCKGLILTTDIRFNRDFGQTLCFSCAQKLHKPSMLSKLLNWLGKHGK